MSEEQANRNQPRSIGAAAAWGLLATTAGVIIALVTWVYPRSPDPVSPVESRIPYMAQVDAYCREAASLAPPANSAPRGDPAAYANWIEEAITQYATLYQRWSTTPYPRQDDKLLRPIIDALENMIKTGFEVVDLLRNGQIELANTAITRMKEFGITVNQRSREYGFRDCQRL